MSSIHAIARNLKDQNYSQEIPIRLHEQDETVVKCDYFYSTLISDDKRLGQPPRIRSIMWFISDDKILGQPPEIQRSVPEPGIEPGAFRSSV